MPKCSEPWLKLTAPASQRVQVRRHEGQSSRSRLRLDTLLLLRSCPRSAFRFANLTLDHRFDIAVRLIDRNKNVIRIVEPERAQICKQMVEIWHRQLNALDFWCCRQRSFAHVEQCVL